MARGISDVGRSRFCAVNGLSLCSSPLGLDAAARIGRREVTTKGDKPVILSGKDFVAYRKEGNDWTIVADIWNTDKE